MWGGRRRVELLALGALLLLLLPAASDAKAKKARRHGHARVRSAPAGAAAAASGGSDGNSAPKLPPLPELVAIEGLEPPGDVPGLPPGYSVSSRHAMSPDGNSPHVAAATAWGQTARPTPETGLFSEASFAAACRDSPGNFRAWMNLASSRTRTGKPKMSVVEAFAFGASAMTPSERQNPQICGRVGDMLANAIALALAALHASAVAVSDGTTVVDFDGFLPLLRRLAAAVGTVEEVYSTRGMRSGHPEVAQLMAAQDKLAQTLNPSDGDGGSVLTAVLAWVAGARDPADDEDATAVLCTLSLYGERGDEPQQCLTRLAERQSGGAEDTDETPGRPGRLCLRGSRVAGHGLSRDLGGPPLRQPRRDAGFGEDRPHQVGRSSQARPQQPLGG